MKKFSWAIVLLLIISLLLSSCTLSDGNDDTTTTPQATTTTSQIKDGGIGGDGAWDMTRKYLLSFSIDAWIWNLVDKDDLAAWEATFEGWGENGTRDVDEFNMYSLITEFSIPREKVEEVCRQYKELFNADYFTDEQVEAIYNGTEVEVYQLFANPYAVMVGKEAYPPQWMVEHTAEDYLAAGITHEILTAEFEQLLVPCTEEQRDYLRAQLQALAELEN